MKVSKIIKQDIDNEGNPEIAPAYLIKMIVSEFPCTIYNTSGYEETKKVFMEEINKLFDDAWRKYEAEKSHRYIYDCGIVD
jgi:hypothetical protein